MSRPKRRRWWFASLLGLLAIGPERTSGQQKPVLWIPATSMADSRLRPTRQAAVSWELRSGPRREIVDQVCLVPDLPTFYQAIASWDEGHFFPVLFDDVETSFRFIRAFHPARIIRMPKTGSAIPPSQLWAKAIEAVGASWTTEANPTGARPRGDRPPKGLGATPPGVVFSSPDAPMLAGAVALAAGHFQPLLRVDFSKKFADNLSEVEAEEFADSLTAKVKEQVTKFDQLGDDCDFLTVAGDWPYAWQGADHERNSVDDRLGRRVDSPERWAFAGRLLGNPKESVYRAMCSLFLQPESALLFNGYEESSPPWSFYSMSSASIRLGAALKATQVSGEKEANLEGWHETLGPINRYGLVMLNSHGSPTAFNIRGGAGSTSDIPFSVPSSVLMIHSFSAYNPMDPDTIAGRWLANGAFVYFGSMNEPFLQSFRLPRLVAEMISEHLPFVVAIRATLDESRDQPWRVPWRLVYLGDPLYRLQPSAEAAKPRLSNWVVTTSWPRYLEPVRPSQDTDEAMFLWSFKASVARLQGKLARGNSGDDLVETLLAIDRTKLSADLKPIYDALLIDVLLQARKRSSLKARLVTIPESERTSAVRRTLETLQAIDLDFAVARKDASAARLAWLDVMKLPIAWELKDRSTARVGQLATTRELRLDWISTLRSALPDRTGSETIANELKRVEGLLKDKP